MGGSGGGGGPTPPRRRSTRGTGGGAGGTGPGDSADFCLSVHEDVRLESPDPAVLPTLKVGQVLDLQTNNGKAPITAVTSSGDTAGAIVPSSLASLLKCMGLGHGYVAKILSIKGGLCIVRITHA